MIEWRARVSKPERILPNLTVRVDDDNSRLHAPSDEDMELDLVITTTNKDLPVTLLQLLSNTLVLYQTVPYLPISSLLTLGATSKSFRTLIHDTPNVFRHLDLTQVKSAQFHIAAIDHGGEIWRNVQLDENVTEDECVGNLLT